MTIRVKDLLERLDEIAPFSSAEEWDNPGIQAGCPDDEVKKVLVSLDPTIDALRSARDRDAQILLTHHPLIFSPIKRIDAGNYPGDVISEALRARISIIAVHTNLDMARCGINDILAGMLGLKDAEAIIKKDGAQDACDGLGRIGYLPEAMTIASAARMVMDALGTTGLMVMGDPGREIKKVAVLGGAGGGELSHAAGRGADLYITGDVRHHEALLAKTIGLALIDAGHYNLERAAMQVFAGMLRAGLKEIGWEIRVETYEDERPPMQYLPKKEV